jgi:hypothetical protein
MIIGDFFPDKQSHGVILERSRPQGQQAGRLLSFFKAVEDYFFMKNKISFAALTYTRKLKYIFLRVDKPLLSMYFTLSASPARLTHQCGALYAGSRPLGRGKWYVLSDTLLRLDITLDHP